jgi:acyl carrier protein
MMLHSDTTSEQIRDFIMAKFPLARKREIKKGDRLLENGIVDSLGILDLVTFLEEDFRITVADEELVPENFDTIETLTAFIQRKKSSSPGQMRE